jgi:hypothetical protein
MADVLIIINFWIDLLANSITVFTSGLALYIFFFKKEKIVTALNVMLNYSYQLTLSDLKIKVESLNHFNTNDPDQKHEVISILNEIEGQLLGNKKLHAEFEGLLQKIKAFLKNEKSLTEPKKRSFVSEIKETIRNIDVSNFNEIITSKKIK